MNLATAPNLTLHATNKSRPETPRLTVAGDTSTCIMRLNRWLTRQREDDTIQILLN